MQFELRCGDGMDLRGYGLFFDASVSRETSREDLPTRHSQPDFMQTAGAVVGPGEGFLRAWDGMGSFSAPKKNLKRE